MKKWMLFVLVAVMCLVCAVAGAEALVDGDWKYVVLEDGTVEITDYNGKDTQLTIPRTIARKK